MSPIAYHLHQSNDSNLIFPPNLPQTSSAVNRLNDTNKEPFEESNGDEVSNDTIHVAFNRGSHQNLVELDRDRPSDGFTVNSSSNSDNTMIQNILSIVRDFNLIF